MPANLVVGELLILLGWLLPAVTLSCALVPRGGSDDEIGVPTNP